MTKKINNEVVFHLFSTLNKPAGDVFQITKKMFPSLTWSSFQRIIVDGINEDNRKMQKKPVFVPYQLCPKCGGQGCMSKPPMVPGDVHQWSHTSLTFTCDVCNGQKIIPMCKL